MNWTRLAHLLVLTSLVTLPACHELRTRREERRAARAAARGDAGTVSAATAPEVIEATLGHAGAVRSYLVHVPAGYSASQAVPLVLAFHGGGGTARGFMEHIDLNRTADAHGFLVVYPDGSSSDRGLRDIRTWNAGDCCGYASRRRIDDVGFVRALIGRLRKTYSIDPARIYATGMSNGASLVYRLACEMADTFAAVAPVSGTIAIPSCRPSRPVSVLHFHGTADQNMPWEGGLGARAIARVEKTSVPDTMEAMRVADRCAGKGSVTRRGDTEFIRYDCPASVEVVLARIEGGGHAWPGAPPGRTGETSSKDVSANEEMWRFFEKHRRD